MPALGQRLPPPQISLQQGLQKKYQVSKVRVTVWQKTGLWSPEFSLIIPFFTNKLAFH